jgi:tetratricopeptide (TPR) repeat protein
MLPKVRGSRTLADRATGDLAIVMGLRGRAGESLRRYAELRASQLERGGHDVGLLSGLDSALVLGFVLDNANAARQALYRGLARRPLDSIPLLNRPDESLLTIAAYLGDTALASRARADYGRELAARGNTVDRPAREALGDALVDLAARRFAQAVARLNEADRLLHPCTECIPAGKFIAFDRLGNADSTIAAGEAYLKINRPGSSGSDVMFRAGILQRLGELYEARGEPEKALPHYEELVDTWKSADPPLQPRVRDVRGRIERIRVQTTKKG